MKNKSVKIVIPMGLTPEQEFNEIGKRLRTRMLSSGGQSEDQIKIGEGIDVSYLKTVIEIERKVENIIELVSCQFCNAEYHNDLFFNVDTNYGGKVKLQKVCSEQCQSGYIDICGVGRASKSKGGLGRLRYF